MAQARSCLRGDIMEGFGARHTLYVECGGHPTLRCAATQHSTVSRRCCLSMILFLLRSAYGLRRSPAQEIVRRASSSQCSALMPAINLYFGPSEEPSTQVANPVADPSAANLDASHRHGQDAEQSESSQSADSCLPAQAVTGAVALGRWVDSAWHLPYQPE